MLLSELKIMIIDIHVHSAEYSRRDSILSIHEAMIRAKTKGLDGICFTDHDNMGIYGRAKDLSSKYDISVFAGIEINTTEGDILVFGPGSMPERTGSARELVKDVLGAGGAAVSAHPYRPGGRGLGDRISAMPFPIGIEVLNGRTPQKYNRIALETSFTTGLPGLGGSDAHTSEEVGRFATFFPDDIRTTRDLIWAIRRGRTRPVCFDGKGFCFFETEMNYKIPVREAVSPCF
jgi:predicted metal-dependent phosphoesterase TrpH